MSQEKRQLKQQIGLVGAIFGTLILSLPAIAQTNPSTRDMRSGTGNNAMCSANTNDTNINRQGPSSVNSNRNTPTPTSDIEARDSRTGTATPSSANSNRNTPTAGTDNSSTRMGNTPSGTGSNTPSRAGSDMSSGTGSNTSSRTGSDRTSSSNTDIERRTREGTSSVNSNRNMPTEDSDRTSVDDTNSSSASTDAMSDRDRNAIRTGDEANCSDGNSTNINRDKQLRRNDYQMMQQRRNTRIITPTPEQRQAASAMVRPSNGAVNVRLVNETGADIVYEVIGETNQRNLRGESYISLESLDTPTTITFYRADGGLLRVRPQAVAPGVLEVRFAATTDLGADKNALTVQPTGGVYLN